MPGFKLSEQESADLVAFLESLTDVELLTDPGFANPWREGPNVEPANRSLSLKHIEGNAVTAREHARSAS